MLALTVRPPWSHAIIALGKDVENRRGLGAWRRVAGQRIAIHAGRTWDDQAVAVIEHITEHPLRRADVAIGAIVGTVLVENVHVATDDGCCDPWGQVQDTGGMSRDQLVHLQLTAPRALRDPIPVRGQLGLWTVPTDIALELDGARA